MADRFICIHGHFYQPPRENPWLEEVEFQESAKPYHDWNERVSAECYAPNAVSRVMDSDWRIIGLINNYSRISFNFGPTLLHWLARHKPKVYESILNADKESMNNFSGHGSAMAQVYNHMIMPLANRRDKETQVKWAIRDFQARFNRYPEGMWLPETAVDIETLEVLAQNKIKFTILGPHQAARMRKIGDIDWVQVSNDNGNGKIDPRRAYLCNLPSGNSINIFFFDKRTASDIAFGNLLESGEAFAKRLADSLQDSGNEPLIESVASDGELYGHHHPHGDMTLAYCIYYIVSNDLAKLTNYAEFLANHPAQFEVEIQENTSWSCIHGIERWRSDCGDNMGHEGWRQSWRKPLREAMDWLRDSLITLFEQQASEFLSDPWAARNNYIDVMLDRSREQTEAFLLDQTKKQLSEVEKRLIMKLLEMQRYSMLMYTSCGWFFDEISGIETVQVLMYAARAMQLAHDLFEINLENGFVNILKNAPSNIPEFLNGANVYSIFVKPAIVDFQKISAQNTIIELFADNIKSGVLTPNMPNCCFKVTTSNAEKLEDSKFRVLVNHSKVYSSITLDDSSYSCAALWLGDHNVSCGIMPNMQDETFLQMKNDLLSSFEKGQINEIIVLLSKYFGQNIYSLKDMFKDDQEHILNYILTSRLKKAKELYEIVYNDNSTMLRFMKETRIPAPKTLRSAAEIVLNMELEELFSDQTSNFEKLHSTLAEIKNLSVTIDTDLIAYKASEKVTEEFNKLSTAPENIETIRLMNQLLRVVAELPMKLNLWQPQNIAFKIAEDQYQKLKGKQDDASKAWVLAFIKLCELIGIRLA